MPLIVGHFARCITRYVGFGSRSQFKEVTGRVPLDQIVNLTRGMCQGRTAFSDGPLRHSPDFGPYRRSRLPITMEQ